MSTDAVPDRPGKRVAKTTHDQLGVPRTPRGTVPDGGHLSPLEKLLMITLGLFGMERATYAELAEAIGLPGSRKKRTNQIHKLLFGRKVGGQHRPGLVQRGWVLIRFENIPGFPNLRIIERADQWTEYLGRGTDEAVALHRGPAGAEVPARTPGSPAIAEAELALGRELRAKHLIDTLVRRGFRLMPGSDGKVAIRPPSQDAAPLGEDERADLVRYQPEVLALLSIDRPCPQSTPPASPVPPVVPEPAPPAPEPTIPDPPSPVDRLDAATLLTDQATALVDRLRSQGVVLCAEGGKVLCSTIQDPADRAELSRLKPQIIEVLSSPRQAAAPGGSAPDQPSSPNPQAPRDDAARGPAPKVERPEEIRGQFGRLRGFPDDSPSRELAVRLAGPTGFRDADQAESIRTYYGLFEDVRRGELSEDCIQQAFEAATKPKIRNRGAMFISQVKGHISRQLAMKKGP